MIAINIMLAIAFPLAWLISEFQPKLWLRLMLDSGSIVMAYGVAWTAGSLQGLNHNSSYGTASQELVGRTLQELESGNESGVIRNLKWFKSTYDPSYETGRVEYERLVGTYIERFDGRHQ